MALEGWNGYGIPLNGWNGMEEGYYSFTPFPGPPSGMMFDGGTVKAVNNYRTTRV